MPDTPKQQAQAKAAAASGKARRREALQAYATLLPTLRQLRQEGLSYGKIADRLNKDGHRTRTNKPWHAAQVWNVLRRARTLRSTSNPK